MRSSHTLTMRLPGNAPPSRHMVEPQSPLDELAPYTSGLPQYIPEVGDDLLARVCDLLVLLRRALGDLEAVLGEYAVAGERASANLAAVGAMAENLHPIISNYPHPEFEVPTLPSLLPAASYATLPHMQLPETILTDWV
ncbi:hypothetical protein HBI70_196810 [Parastagonospora nodorum]|nr:hypothetical protein HBI13_190490 [Parastagonospora nodorum]KAH4061803.1 hypothetical protein HBH50_215560 [Parastagonospora nodorum]KAH4184219.1 hypothetical protein HBH42_193730 [Parastagonospora nodorum]KAH4218705.1 hypothetical protein HBI06_198680 [Parastagonospora nodorum]KAH4251688.1 hypothetical protein HBI03_220870 [Parastagonospora nodorum]